MGDDAVDISVELSNDLHHQVLVSCPCSRTEEQGGGEDSADEARPQRHCRKGEFEEEKLEDCRNAQYASSEHLIKCGVTTKSVCGK